MREHKAPNNEMVLYSYGIGFGYLFVAMLVTGNILPGLRFCATVRSGIATQPYLSIELIV